MSNTMDYPPILPTIEEELKQFLLCPENLPIHQYEKNQQFWPREPNLKELLGFEESPQYSTLKVKRDVNTGEIIDFREMMNDIVESQSTVFFNNTDSQERSKLDTELLTIPPGFNRGLVFNEDGQSLINKPDENRKKKTFGDLPNVNLFELIWNETGTVVIPDLEQEETAVSEDNMVTTQSVQETLPEEDEIIPNEPLVLKISETPAPKAITETEWAIQLDTNQPVDDFEEQLPEMAMNYPFELDIFQKLAILQLEKKNNVFVAAHTSAGKTVVAEYAIALSKLHRTRAVYTSPIKALSNQKYRDFKITFNDVGLITGDFQINKTASCLIMTTEILRSMLYSKSEITNDLEYVIFDEVHYINDRERGYVWEQVLIMLPPKVCVVLLSATVPNTMEFADWLGRTRQKKVYVVTTSKRPVPLKHYLYTGRGGKSKDNRFNILDVDRWVPGGYTKAKDSLNMEQKNSFYKWGSQQDKTLWSALIDHLKKNDLLPVVAFTFSRQKCDNNAVNLLHLDLLNTTEKDHVKYFFNKCIKCLKEADRSIPQVLKMRDILSRGVGVHHSGILPIIKEIVEMLFQQGYIKLLFATETFAMGVNMPARTVVFDSVRKHDGKELRDLEPAEYIQMAGRAGRRGLDKEGTVLILCKQEVPSDENLKKMMLGKPSLLVSQFRLTYGMVLSLLKADNLSVESMMSNSFGEANHQRNLVALTKKLQLVEKQILDLEDQQIGDDLQPLVEFYEAANNYLRHRNDIMNNVIVTLKVQKILSPGRIIVITQKHHKNKLAMVLSFVKGKQPSYKVLILSDLTVDIKNVEKEDFCYYMMALAEDRLNLPTESQCHEILQISPMEIFEITSKTLHLNTENVIRDVEKRQMERFRDAPIGQTCVDAVSELRKLTTLANNGDPQTVLGYLHYVADIKVNEQDLYHKLKEMYDLKEALLRTVEYKKIKNFEEMFVKVFKKKHLEEKRRHLQFLLSHESLSLYPDYENRIDLLKKMEYVDSQNRPEFKGKVACVMGMNELMITELVVRNILTKLTAAEGAALLSALVYRVKVKEAPDYENLPSTLIKAIEDMKNIHDKIGSEELALGIQSDEFQDELNFGLVNIVYEWAINKPFADIMELTDIQEGIIVRCIQQLNETIMDVRDAAKYVGNPELQMKMEEASSAIKRDIVFAASLYTNN